jgi:hypothetical protein
MNFLKKIYFGIMILIILACIAVMMCAMNPTLTESVAGILYGTENTKGLLEGRDSSEDISVSEIIATIPDNVDGKSGYQPVSGSGEQVDDTEAKTLRERLGTGETGEDLTFDPLFYPYYAMLTEDQQTIYRQIYANAQEGNASFSPKVEVNTQDLQNAFEAVVGDHPELFYLETGYSVKYTQKGMVVEVDLSYYTLLNDLDQQTEVFRQAASDIITAAAAYTSDYDKEKYVHDALIQLVSYNASAKMSQSAYSALINQSSVCAGYSRAYQYILQRLGIPCYYCTGSSGEDHAWNIVKLSDGYYNVDVTWDDTDPATYDYFNRTDADFAGTHVRKSLSVYLPACNAVSYRGLESSGPKDVIIEQTEEGDETVTRPSSALDAPINPNPTEPLRYDDPFGGTPAEVEEEPSDTTLDVSGNVIYLGDMEELASLALKYSDVCWSISQYYDACKKAMVEAGTGQQNFLIIIPSSMYNAVESTYVSGAYKNGYVTSALESLKMTNFQITLQAQKFGNGYYKLYHNVDTW